MTAADDEMCEETVTVPVEVLVGCIQYIQRWSYAEPELNDVVIARLRACIEAGKK